MSKKYSRYQTPSLLKARKRLGEKVEFINYQMDAKYQMIGINKTYCVKTYGCQGNLADSEKISGLLEQMGYTAVLDESKADVVLFNTCAIRENAENRIFGELGRFVKYKKNNPGMIIGICGCMMQEENTIEMIRKKYPHVNLIFGTHNINKLPEYLYEISIKNENLIEVFSIEGDIYEDLPVKRDHPYKAWVNIMYGCDEFCTYCIVPYTRGKERSRKPEDILKEVEELIKLGYKEVTLLGQNVNAYGNDFKDRKYSFADLLRDLQKMPIERVRYTTSHPRDLDDETIEVMGKGGNIMPHLHLPVQSGNNNILKRMNRKYTREEYLTKIEKLKKAVPGISITTDIIVAFPGETVEEFNDTLSLVEAVKFEGAFTFIYSPREGTPAATYPNPLTEEQKHARLNELNETINKYYLEGNLRFENQIVKVLVEGKSKNNDNMYTGYSEHNKLVNFEGSDDLIGQIVDVKITKAYSWHLLGELVK